MFKVLPKKVWISILIIVIIILIGGALAYQYWWMAKTEFNNNNSSIFSNLKNTFQGVSQDEIATTLSYKIKMKEYQILYPTPKELEYMKSIGMIIIQKIYIRLYKPLTTSQANELKALGITLYSNSWMPSANNSPAGSIRADVPVDKMNVLADKDYIVSLETAERVYLPMGGSSIIPLIPSSDP